MLSLFILSLLSLYCVDGNTSSLPKTFNQRAKPLAIGAASVLALSAFKIVADGQTEYQYIYVYLCIFYYI